MPSRRHLGVISEPSPPRLSPISLHRPEVAALDTIQREHFGGAEAHLLPFTPAAARYRAPDLAQEMGRRWGRDGVEMVQRWGRDGTEMGQRWDRDGAEMAQRWARDGGRDGQEMPNGDEMGAGWARDVPWGLGRWRQDAPWGLGRWRQATCPPAKYGRSQLRSSNPA